MALTLDDVAQAYLADTEFQQTRQTLRDKRNASIPTLQAVTQQFINGEADLQVFRARLEGRAAASPYLSSRDKAAPTGLHKDETTCYTVVYGCTTD